MKSAYLKPPLYSSFCVGSKLTVRLLFIYHHQYTFRTLAGLGQSQFNWLVFVKCIVDRVFACFLHLRMGFWGFGVLGLFFIALSLSDHVLALWLWWVCTDVCSCSLPLQHVGLSFSIRWQLPAWACLHSKFAAVANPTSQQRKNAKCSGTHTHHSACSPQPLPGIIQITLFVHFERTPTLPLTLLILRKRQVYLYLGHFSLNQKNTQMIFELLISMAFIHIHVHYIWILEVTLSHVFFNFSRILDQE